MYFGTHDYRFPGEYTVAATAKDTHAYTLKMEGCEDKGEVS